MKTKEILKEWKNYLNEVSGEDNEFPDKGIYDEEGKEIDFTNDEDYFHEYKHYCEEILRGVQYDPNSFDAGHKRLYTSIVSRINKKCEEDKKSLEYARKNEKLYYDNPSFMNLESKAEKDELFNEWIRNFEKNRDRDIAKLHNPDGTINRELVYEMSPSSNINYITYDAKFVLDTNGHLYLKMKDGSLASVTEEILPFRGEEG